MSREEVLAPTADPEEIERRLGAISIPRAMETQRSIRRVSPDPVDDTVIRRCIELSLEAPTGSNGQNWEFIVVRDPKIRSTFATQYRRAWKLYGGMGRRIAKGKPDEAQMLKIIKSVQWQVDNFETIPVLVVCCLNGGHGRIPFVPSPPVANSGHYGSIYPSVQNLLLAARAIGLGASLITLPLWSEMVARRALGLPLGVEPCCIVALGWPLGRYGPKARKDVRKVIHQDTFGKLGP
ncbi:MAG TPA: nitroreductase family protein [Acidimicrobiales bacterium]|nr:nitroreductase family protein [Acidimicrobiales bacterium]